MQLHLLKYAQGWHNSEKCGETENFDKNIKIETGKCKKTTYNM